MPKGVTTNNEFVKIVRRVISQAPAIQHKTCDDVFLQTLSGSNPKLRAAMRIDAIAHRDDCVEIIEIDVARNCPFSLGLNYSGIPNSCLYHKI
ncbi:MAG: hypothetical protein ALAOOOJD_00582 [bacterium]|nr:hypothetical protein [bacterium]